MKYIIEIEEEPCMYEYGIKFYQCKNVPYWSISDRNISKLEPYTEPDRKAIEDEVWELANYMGRMSLTERDLCFGFPLPQEVTMNLSYNEAKSKFEAWLGQKDEIRVGDELKDHEDIKAVVLDIGMDGETYTVYTENSICEDWLKDEGFVKTGRYFPEVAELLEKMRGGTE